MNIDLALLYMNEKASKQEKEAFERWLRESPQNFQEFEDFKASWYATGKAYANFTPDKSLAWENIEQKTRYAPKKIRLFPNILKIAAFVAILVGLGSLTRTLYLQSQVEEMLTFNTTSFVLDVALNDGSHVWLKPGSSLSAPKVFKGKKRKVYLKGSAFFEVTKNPNRPFLIAANHTITRVLGTSFYLDAADSLVSLTVVTGKVSLSDENDPEKKVIILPGQTGKLDAENANVSENNNQNFMSWKTEKINFDKAGIEEICKVLSDVYKIEIDPGQLKNNNNLSFTGSFENKPLVEVMNVIELTLGIKFEKNEHAFYLVLTE